MSSADESQERFNVSDEEPERVSLGQSLKARHISMIALGGIIGAGLFVGSSASISTTGPAIVLSYLLAGTLVVLVMRMLAEMAMIHSSSSNSFPELVRQSLGPLAGYMCGWLYWYFWVIVVPIEALAGAEIVSLYFQFIPVWAIAMILLTLLLLSNLFSVRSFAEFEFWFSLCKVSAIVIFILIAFLYVIGVIPGGSGLTNITQNQFMPRGISSVFAGVVSVIFAMTGAEIATIAAAEAEEPQTLIANLTLSIALRIIVFYVVSIFLVVAVVPWQTISPGDSPFGMALKIIGIPGSDVIMNIIVLIAVLSCLNSGLYASSRAIFTLSQYGDAPKWLTSLSQRQVPLRSLAAASAVSYLALGVSVISPQRVFLFLLNSCGATMVFLYLLISVAQLRMRRTIERQAPERLVIKMWLFPYLTITAIVAMLAVLIFMAITPGLTEQLWMSLIAAALFAALSPSARALYKRTIAAFGVKLHSQC
jgi:GABA permease